MEGIPLFGSFIQSGLLAKVKTVFKEEIKLYKQQVIRDVAEQIGHAVDVKEMVYEKISDYDMAHLESIVKRIARRELRYIELLGGVLGFMIGCLQAGLIIWTGAIKL